MMNHKKILFSIILFFSFAAEAVSQTRPVEELITDVKKCDSRSLVALELLKLSKDGCVVPDLMQVLKTGRFPYPVELILTLGKFHDRRIISDLLDFAWNYIDIDTLDIHQAVFSAIRTVEPDWTKLAGIQSLYQNYRKEFYEEDHQRVIRIKKISKDDEEYSRCIYRYCILQILMLIEPEQDAQFFLDILKKNSSTDKYIKDIAIEYLVKKKSAEMIPILVNQLKDFKQDNYRKLLRAVVDLSPEWYETGEVLAIARKISAKDFFKLSFREQVNALVFLSIVDSNQFTQLMQKILIRKIKENRDESESDSCDEIESEALYYLACRKDKRTHDLAVRELKKKKFKIPYIYALSHYCDPESLALLLNLLKSKDGTVVDAALWALKDFYPEKAYASAKQLLGKSIEDDFLFGSVLGTMMDINATQTLQEIEKGLENGTLKKQAERIISCIVYFNFPQKSGMLIKLLSDWQSFSESTKVAVIECFIKTKELTAMPILEKMQSDPSPSVRAYAEWAIYTISH